MLDKWDCVPSTAHTTGLKRTVKGAGEEDGGSSRDHGDREGQGYRNWEEGV